MAKTKTTYTTVDVIDYIHPYVDNEQKKVDKKCSYFIAKKYFLYS